MFYNPPTPAPTDSGELVWRVQVSGFLRDITRELVALSEVVQKIAERLAEQEEKDGL